MRVPLAAAAACLAVALAGCGGSGSGSEGASATETTSSTTQPAIPNADELAATVIETMSAVTSVRMVGTQVVDGDEMTFDSRGTHDGSNQEVAMTLNGNAEGTILTVDGTFYLKGNEAMWAALGAGPLASTLPGKWVRSREGVEEGPPIPTLKVLLDELEKDDSATEATNFVVEEVTLDGKPAYRISDPVGKDDTVVWTSTDDKAMLLKMQGTAEDGPVSVTFSEWNEVPLFTAPPSDQVTSL